MAHEIEFDVRVNKEGDREEVIMRASGGVSSIVLHPEGSEQGYFKSGKAKGVFTMAETAPSDAGPVVPESTKNKNK